MEGSKKFHKVFVAESWDISCIGESFQNFAEEGMEGFICLYCANWVNIGLKANKEKARSESSKETSVNTT